MSTDEDPFSDAFVVLPDIIIHHHREPAGSLESPDLSKDTVRRTAHKTHDASFIESSHPSTNLSWEAFSVQRRAELDAYISSRLQQSSQTRASIARDLGTSTSELRQRPELNSLAEETPSRKAKTRIACRRKVKRVRFAGLNASVRFAGSDGSVSQAEEVRVGGRWSRMKADFRERCALRREKKDRTMGLWRAQRDRTKASRGGPRSQRFLKPIFKLKAKFRKTPRVTSDEGRAG